MVLSKHRICFDTECFRAIQTPLGFVKTTPMHVMFSSLFLVFRYLAETLSLVFDIFVNLFNLSRFQTKPNF